MVEPGDEAPDAAEPTADEGGGAWQRLAAFFCFGMAVGAPAAQSIDAVRILPAERTVEAMLALPVILIGPMALARVVTAPFIDAFDPPLFRALGRRSGWTALLAGVLLVLMAPILIMAQPGNPLSAPVGPLDFALMLAAMLVAGALLAAVDGLRSAGAPERAQGSVAAAQYLGTIVPAALLTSFLRAPDGVTIAIFLCAFIALAWLGLWLRPEGEAASLPLFARPDLVRFLGGEQNLSRGGKAITAWLYGVFVCPFTDFFRRFGGLAWAIIAVLLLGDLATHLDTGQLLRLNAEFLTSARVNQIGTIRSISQFAGAVLAGWLVWRTGAARGLAAAFVLAAAAAIAGLFAIAAAPSLPWFTTALVIGAVAQGAILIGFVAFIARVVEPTHAAWQFTLLWLAGLPTGVITALRNMSDATLGISGTHVVFLVLLAASIALTRWLARRLDAQETGG
jgi:MFS transporter, PAT family, beta-lactamase induction signal transducer AmpG